MENEERFRLHEEMIQGLARLWERQDEINQRMALAIERIEATLEAIKDMLGRSDGR
jgi:hypothetical protein